jgi:hypothetical protein
MDVLAEGCPDRLSGESILEGALLFGDVADILGWAGDAGGRSIVGDLPGFPLPRGLTPA